MGLIKKDLTTGFDRRREREGAHWVQVRYIGAGDGIDITKFDATIDYRIRPNPIVIDHGMVKVKEVNSMTKQPEVRHQWSLKVVKDTFPAHLALMESVAATGSEAKYMLAVALSANAFFQLSEDDGVSWQTYRSTRDIKKTPERYWFTLVPAAGPRNP